MKTGKVIDSYGKLMASVPSQEIHEIGGRRRVRAERRRHDVARRVSPALVPVVGAVGGQGGGERLGEQDGALLPLLDDDVGRRLPGHVEHVQRTVDLQTIRNVQKNTMSYNNTRPFLTSQHM